MTISGLIFIIAAFCIVLSRFHQITTEPTLRSHSFKDPANQLLWDNGVERLVVGSKNTRTSFDKHLNVITVEETAPCTYGKCKHGARYANEVLAISLVTEKAIITCEAKNKEFCMKYILEPSAISKIPFAPTTGHKCSDELEWRLGESISGKKNIFIESLRKNIDVSFGFIRQDDKFIISTQFLNEQQVETKLTRFSVKEANYHSPIKIIISCEDEKQTVWQIPTSAAFSNKIYSLGRFENHIGSGEVLFINFKANGLNGGNHESALCMFPMAQFDDLMKEADSEQGFCRKSDDTFQLRGEPLLLYEEEGTSLAIKTENNRVLAFIGTSRGNLLKFELDRHTFPSPLFNTSLLPYRGTNQSTTSGIRRSNSFDNKEDHLFLLVDNTVIRFPVSSCFPYETFKTCVEGPLACGWCDTKCTVQEQCSGKFVNDWAVYYQGISIVLNSPTSGPLEGGTTLNLRISFSGIDVVPEKEQVQFTVGDIKCKKSSWKRVNKDLNQEWSVECKTGKNGKESIVPVVMHISALSSYREIAKINSKSPYFYLKPQLFGIHPGFGPKVGGTTITLYGRHLNIGSTRKVVLDEVTCDILDLTYERVVCKTGPLKTLHAGVHKSRLRLWIDGNQVEPTGQSTMNLKREFEYRMNPIITQVSTNVTTVSGGTLIIVNGRYLNSVHDPELSVTINGIEKIQKCTATYKIGTEISCRTPPLDHSVVRPMGLRPVRATLSFKFDGIPEKELYENSTFRHRFLYYYADPVLDEPPTILTANDIIPELVLKGKNLNTTFKISDVKVTANNVDLCNVTALTFSTLHCKVWTTVQKQLEVKGETNDIHVRFGKLPYYVGRINLKSMDLPTCSFSQNQASYRHTMNQLSFFPLLVFFAIFNSFR